MWTPPISNSSFNVFDSNTWKSPFSTIDQLKPLEPLPPPVYQPVGCYNPGHHTSSYFHDYSNSSAFGASCRGPSLTQILDESGRKLNAFAELQKVQELETKNTILRTMDTCLLQAQQFHTALKSANEFYDGLKHSPTYTSSPTPIYTSSYELPVPHSRPIHTSTYELPVSHSRPIYTSSYELPVQHSLPINTSTYESPVPHSRPIYTSSYELPVPHIPAYTVSKNITNKLQEDLKQCKASCDNNFDKTMKQDTLLSGCASAMSGGDAFMAPIVTELKAAHENYDCHKTCDKLKVNKP
jgi:hypothetical protein